MSTLSGINIRLHRSRFVLYALSVLILLAICANQASALDGRLAYRSSRNEGGLSLEDYSTTMISREAVVHQRVPIGDWLFMHFDLRNLQDNTESTIGESSSSWNTLTQRGNLGLQYSSNPFRMRLNGGIQHREYSSAGLPLWSQDRHQMGGWASLRTSRLLSLQGSWQNTESWRDDSAGSETHNRQNFLSFNSDSDIPCVGLFEYRFSRIKDEAISRGSHTVNINHDLSYSGDLYFADHKGAFHLVTRSHFFRQRSVRHLGGEELLLLPPFSAGFVIDSTPEIHDPLEPELVLVPALHDGNLTSPTQIDIGDDAPAGWQVGGDYRNIQFDFGQATEITSAFLYVDRLPLVPDMWRWLVFVSDDPAGRDWTELASGAYQVEFMELNTGLQGWRFTLNETVSGRFFKLVDTKIGAGGPKLFVTELELYSPQNPAEIEDESQTNSHRIMTTFEYRLSKHWHWRYSLNLRRRSYGQDAEDLNEVIHAMNLSWDRASWRVKGSYELFEVDRGIRSQTDVNSSIISLQRRFGNSRSVTAFWNRVEDQSVNLNRLTHTLSLGTIWQFAPGLRLNQKLNYGWFDNNALHLSSRSVTLFTVLSSTPFARMEVDISHIKRWVERDADVGFSRFDDSTLSVNLSPLPYVSIRSRILHQARDEDNWRVDNTLNWTPLQGGAMQIRFYANHASDTRVDSSNFGTGAGFTWKPRNKLRFEGGLEAQNYQKGGVESAPLNSYLRGNLAF